MKKYLELQSVADTSKWLNQKGYRVNTGKGNRKYISNDITKIINDKHCNASDKLKEFAKALYKKNYNYSKKVF
ncbi:hypothetical protein TZ02_04815 [Clostridium aceticum]|uniref:hypothetical protein n=1 Tax=Clostridium aceticum TaxID=84022 RepID=UPI0005CF4BFB|nr:hypothetical protein [Clostridium aceticum]KJF27903.1 hypothetical protein TZ02_04815 [Clostridium aceticum]